MKMRVGLAIIAASISAHAQTSVPVLVQIHGTGVVRVRVTQQGVDAIFEGSMQAGQSMWLQSATNCVTVEHTYGSFRDVQWAPQRTFCRRGVRHGPQDPYIRVDLSTDSP